MRVLWFVFALVFLQPVYSNEITEGCKSEADKFKRIAEGRYKRSM